MSITSLVGIASSRLELKQPNDFSDLKQLEVLVLCSCTSFMSLLGIANAFTLCIVDACDCRKLKELPNDFNNLKKL